jgi:DNA-binding XRE family transcriptional regulator
MPKKKSGPDPFALSIAAKLRHATGGRRGAQAALAHALKTTEGTVSLWFSGQQSPGLQYAIKLCKYFDWNLFYLVDATIRPCDAPPAWGPEPPPALTDDEGVLLRHARALGEELYGRPDVTPALEAVLAALRSARSSGPRRRAVDTPLDAEKAEAGRPRPGPSEAPRPSAPATRPGKRRRTT